MICTASRHRPVSKKIKNPMRSSASSPFHHLLPQPGPPWQLSLNGPPRQLSLNGPPRQLSFNSDLSGSSPSIQTSPAALPACHENPRSQTSLQKFQPLHVWLPAQAFSCTIPSSSPKTIKWSSLLNQFFGAASRLPAPGAAIRLPVRPPSDRSHMSPLRSSKS